MLYMNMEKIEWYTPQLHITNGNCSPPCSGGSGSAKPQSGLRPLYGFAPLHLGQGSLLRNALLPAPNVSYLNTLCVIWRIKNDWKTIDNKI
jgi:hypothetical protein